MSGLNPKNRDFLHKIIENILVLPFDSGCAKIAAEIYRNLKKSNKLIGISDMDF
jgi:predicted nucleic acid-binding protein